MYIKVSKSSFKLLNVYRPMNMTLITSIPKVAQAMQPKDFRPITCCTMLYKIIAKVLTNRLGQVIS